MAPVLKRPAAVATDGAGSKSKKPRENPVAAKCKEITAVVSSAEGFPTEVLKGLSQTAGSCLAVPKAQRHKFQIDILNMIDEVLVGEASRVSDKSEALKAKVAGADAEKVAREAALEAALAAAEQQAGAEGVARVAVQAVSDEIASLVAAKERAEAGWKVRESSLEKCTAKKAALEEVHSGALKSLEEGTAKSSAKLLKVVAKAGKDAELEERLLEFVPVCLGTAPAKRGDVDRMVIAQFSEKLGAVIGRLAEESASTAEDEELKSKIEAAKAELDEAQSRGQGCKEQLQAAQQSLKDAQAASKAAKKAVTDFGGEMKAAAASTKAALEEVRVCSDALASFRELVEGLPIESEVPAATEVPAAEPVEAAEVTEEATDGQVATTSEVADSKDAAGDATESATKEAMDINEDSGKVEGVAEEA